VNREKKATKELREYTGLIRKKRREDSGRVAGRMGFQARKRGKTKHCIVDEGFIAG